MYTVLLNGDFNARTQNVSDFVDADDFLTRHFECVDSLLELICLINIHIFQQKEPRKMLFETTKAWFC